MFFPERIKSIKRADRVLDVGPGGFPHPRANVLLEKRFDDPKEAEGQRGRAQPARTKQPVIHFDGGRFPFADREFDYVICSHVLEHVEDVSTFVSELVRVGKRGYVEFPTAYYDHVYNIPEHISLVLFRDGEIRWMPKRESILSQTAELSDFFYRCLNQGYIGLIEDTKPLLFQGFEWERDLPTRRVSRLCDVLYDLGSLELPNPPPRGFKQRLAALFNFR